MQTIFVIDDELINAKNAAVLAFELAKNTGARIVIGSFKSMASEPAVHMLVNSEGIDELTLNQGQGLLTYLNTLNENKEDCGCIIEELEVSQMTTDCLASFLNQNQTLMVIKSVTGNESDGWRAAITFNMPALLNKIFAPICLVPTEWCPRALQSLAYITDLRYCRTDILSHLFKYTTPDAAVYIAHMAMPGVVDLVPEFAGRLFEALIEQFSRKRQLYLHQIKEKVSMTVADVLVNGMNNDALILTNHSDQFHQLIGKSLEMKYPDFIQVPVLIYPA